MSEVCSANKDSPSWERAIGSRKLSANEQFFVGAYTVISLLQTTQIISDVCFITDHVAYASSKIHNRLNRDGTLFTRGGCASCLCECLGARLLPQSYQYSNLTASVDSCAEIKSAPSAAWLNLAEFGGRCRKAMLGVCPYRWLASQKIWSVEGLEALTCGHKAKGMIPSIFLEKDERGPSSIRWILELFERQRWGTF